MLNLIIEIAKKIKLIKSENMILQNSISKVAKEDKTIKIIAKEFSEFLIRIQNNLERK
ncbi:MAG: hypothetical protein IPM32_07155 [Ignavibacteriae bacterium]|nr:hypothetical protein [Ignavibacteriota bacterium]